MPMSRSPLSLVSASTGVATGRVVSLARPATRVTAQIRVTGSTKAIVRVKGSVDGVTWTSLGSANTTATTAGATVTSTGANLFRLVRVDQVSMVAKVGGQTISASVIGA